VLSGVEGSRVLSCPIVLLAVLLAKAQKADAGSRKVAMQKVRTVKRMLLAMSSFQVRSREDQCATSRFLLPGFSSCDSSSSTAASCLLKMVMHLNTMVPMAAATSAPGAAHEQPAATASLVL
jgi:hypothetical protein